VVAVVVQLVAVVVVGDLAAAVVVLVTEVL
jgi:hypothetical protein